MRRRVCHVLVLVGVVATASACGSDEAVDDRFERASRDTTTTEATGGEGTTSEGGSTDTSSTTAAPRSAGESLLAGVDAYRTALAPGPIRALQYTQHFPVDSTSYASMQSQDPAVPANVDERQWRNGEVSDPAPVQLSGDGTLEENLFTFDEIDWNAVAAALPGAPALVEQQVGTTFENSDGVTHIIAERDLPFSADTVVRVYVDGGDRTSGGYVELGADGAVRQVMA